VARDRHSAVIACQRKRRGGRGTGAVKATGSYEGSPPMEGIPGHHEPSLFTRRWSRWPRRLLTLQTSTSTDELRRCGDGKRRRRPSDLGRNEGEATGMSEARSNMSSVGRTTPTLSPPRRRNRRGEEAPTAARWGITSSVDPPKRSERRENARLPGQAARIPESVGRPRGESRDRFRERTRYGYTLLYVRVAEVDRTHRASCPSGDRKVS